MCWCVLDAARVYVCMCWCVLDAARVHIKWQDRGDSAVLYQRHASRSTGTDHAVAERVVVAIIAAPAIHQHDT